MNYFFFVLVANYLVNVSPPTPTSAQAAPACRVPLRISQQQPESSSLYRDGFLPPAVEEGHSISPQCPLPTTPSYTRQVLPLLATLPKTTIICPTHTRGLQALELYLLLILSQWWQHLIST